MEIIRKIEIDLMYLIIESCLGKDREKNSSKF